MEKLVRQIVESITSFPRPKNWVLKLLSLLFALFLWYFVVGEDKVDMTVTIPVEIVNLPRELIISNQFKKQLEVTVSGALPVFKTYYIVEEVVYDAIFAAGAAGYGTAQTGDAFARLGPPAGASVSADVAAVKTDTGNIETECMFGI